MSWILLALVPGLLWSVTNYIDKILIEKYFKGGGLGSLFLISSLSGLLVLPFAGFLAADISNLGFASTIIAIVSGVIGVTMLFPYFAAVQDADPIYLIPIFQTIPFFSFMLGFIFWGEVLSPNQVVGGLIVTSAAILIGFDFNTSRLKLKWKSIGLMLLTSLMVALNTVLFKVFAIESDFWTVAFWEYIGWVGTGVIFLFVAKKFRKQFFEVLRTNSTAVAGANITNELLNLVARLVFNHVSLLAPITLAWVINGAQPAFVFIFGLLLTVFLPRLYKEETTIKLLFQKIFFICIMAIGLIILSA